LKKSTLYFTIFNFIIWSCEDNIIKNPSDPCESCGLEIYSDVLEELSEGHYIMEFGVGVTSLKASTNCGWSQRIQWDTDYQIKIGTDWVSLVNPASMTDEDGNAQIIFNVWEEFIGYTVEVIGGYTDDCGDHHWDSIQITIVNEDSS